MPRWYAQNGHYLTTKFFGVKANRYLHDHGISQQTMAKVAAKNFRNGALNPNAFRRKPISEEDILTRHRRGHHPDHLTSASRRKSP